ncbi:WXG100 family type VII secretion target [Streptomyces sp. NBC_00094]|uniref:WXG100 family type VII secretion target n=1 Tax=Streptomyces sp. NBC_00094 TaxID=2903620 RepID=UPI0022566C4F|nr:WXG100 family type VII secretion target [Streptomyces sp. NBC_00094]MCX5391763.1 WXG100 family type VII secretion target [Streptomyces sp. NBC_00094]
MQNADLDVSEGELTKLAGDLDAMQGYLEQQTRRMDAIVDSIAAGWQGPTAKAYRSLHQEVAEDAVRIRNVMILLEEATRLSRDGFTQQELDTLGRIRKLQEGTDVPATARAWGSPDPAPVPDSVPSRPQSRILDI